MFVYMHMFSYAMRGCIYIYAQIENFNVSSYISAVEWVAFEKLQLPFYCNPIAKTKS